MSKLLKNLLLPRGLFAGYSFRGKIKNDYSGDLGVVQLKDLIRDYSQVGKEYFLVQEKHVPERHYLRDGDILFIAKGAHNVLALGEGA